VQGKVEPDESSFTYYVTGRILVYEGSIRFSLAFDTSLSLPAESYTDFSIEIPRRVHFVSCEAGGSPLTPSPCSTSENASNVMDLANCDLKKVSLTISGQGKRVTSTVGDLR
jgi:hypothetical protein